jgi:hypothetical protein
MLILKNARIFSPIPLVSGLNAVAIKSGRIAAIGSNTEILNLATSGDKIEDFHGDTIFPGFCDSHLHLHYLTTSLDRINCETDTLSQCLDLVKVRAEQTPPGNWVLGHGWNQNLWQDGYGNLEDLDSITRQHPVYLTHQSLHCGWVNSRALEICGINKESPDPPGGFIGRNPDGSLNGLFFESALALIENKLPPITAAALSELLKKTQTFLWQNGITSAHDFDGSICFSALQILDNANQLKIRVVKSIPYSSLDSIVQVGLQTGFGSNFLEIGPLKLFSDGAMGSKTAAMLTPYENDGENLGKLLLTGDEVFQYGRKAVDNGISLAVHAIGDHANREVLKGFRKLRDYEKSRHLNSLRHRIEHVQLLSKENLGELAALNIIASVQPVHIISDMITADRYWGKRSEYAFAFKSLEQNKTKMIFGSDSPVESPNPFWGIHAAINRQNLAGQPVDNGWYPEQKLSLKYAINAYTRFPAETSYRFNKTGSLKQEFYADLIRLPGDIFQLPEDEIKDLKPIATMVAGEWVWNSEDPQ